MLGLCLVEVSPHPPGDATALVFCLQWICRRSIRHPVTGEVHKGCDEEIGRQQGGRLSQRRSQVHRRMDRAYQDKLDGKISEEFWMRKSGEWPPEENAYLQKGIRDFRPWQS